MVNKNSLRKDFEIFSKGIQRLEELKAELNSLNIRGFEIEAASIKAKLKNVSEIPNIERDLKKLKLKISGKYKPKQRKNPFEGKIKILEEEIAKKSSLCKKDSKYLKEIPRLQEQLYNLRKEFEKTKKTEARKKEILKRIDPSVDLLANEAFDMSLNDIKAELSERIKNKESEVQTELEDDLKLREQAFKQKYSDLEKKYHFMYENQVEHQLKKDIQKKFNKILSERLKFKKAELSKKELQELREKSQKEFDSRKSELRRKLHSELKEAKDSMKKHFEEELLLHKHELHQKFEQDVADEISKLRRNYSEKERQLKAALKSVEESKNRRRVQEVKDILEKEKLVNDKLGEEIRAIKTKLLVEKQNKQSKIFSFNKLFSKERALERKLTEEKALNDKLNSEKVMNENKFKDEIKRTREKAEEIRKEIEGEKQKEIQNALRKKTEQIKEEARRNFEERLKVELKKKEIDFEKKKIAFEENVRKKAQLLFH